MSEVFEAVTPTEIAGCYLLRPRVARDERGSLIKTFHDEAFRKHGLRTDFREEYFSVSNAGVLRGLHFQVPPAEHAKLVYCSAGTVLDATVDLRKSAPSFRKGQMVELSAENAHVLYIPAGVAHGFYVTGGPATLIYKVTSVHAPGLDRGIRWDSCGLKWPNASPVLSVRDRGFPTLQESQDLFA